MPPSRLLDSVKVSAGHPAGSGYRPYFHFSPYRFVHQHRPTFSPKIVRSAAPAPLLGLKHEPGFHGILMNIVELLLTLSSGLDYEIVEAALPHVPEIHRQIPRISLLRVTPGTQAAEQSARKSLLDGLHDYRWIAALGLAE